jgi:hypothetical protein
LAAEANVGLMKLTPFGLPLQQKTKYAVFEAGIW